MFLVILQDVEPQYPSNLYVCVASMNLIPGNEVHNQTLILVLLLGREPFSRSICMYAAHVCAVTFVHVHRVGMAIPLFRIPRFTVSQIKLQLRLRLHLIVAAAL